MSEAVEIWLQKASVIPGVLACGVRGTDHSVVANSCDDTLPVSQVQSALREILDVVQTMRDHRIGTDRLRWTFEKGRIHCTMRPDGALAAMVVMAELDMSPEIESLLLEFASVPC
jgi:hypothetical protein